MPMAILQLKWKRPLPQAIYRLRIGAGKLFLVLEDASSTVTVKGTLEGMRTSDIEIRGSESAKDFMDAIICSLPERLLRMMSRITSRIHLIRWQECRWLSMRLATGRSFMISIRLQQLNWLKKYPNHEYTAQYATFAAGLEQAAASRARLQKPSRWVCLHLILPLQSPDGKTLLIG